MDDEFKTGFQALPLEPDREYDLPGGPHLGHAAALNVPCSDGSADFELDRPTKSYDDLIAEESPIEPGRQMEAGTEYDAKTRARLGPLFAPLHVEHDVI
jgi:hypothetical protein